MQSPVLPMVSRPSPPECGSGSREEGISLREGVSGAGIHFGGQLPFGVFVVTGEWGTGIYLFDRAFHLAQNLTKALVGDDKMTLIVTVTAFVCLSHMQGK